MTFIYTFLHVLQELHTEEKNLRQIEVATFLGAVEQMKLIQHLDEEDKQTILKLIDKMLTNKKFKDFFQKNVAAL
jgi:hypothetical protein